MKSLFNFADRLDGFHDRNYTVTGAIVDKWNDGRRIHVVGTLTFSNNYAAGGETLDMVASLTNSIQGGGGLGTTKQPLFVAIEGLAGFKYQYDITNKKVMVFTNTAGGANGALGEHTAAAVVAGVTGDTIRFYAIFPR